MIQKHKKVYIIIAEYEDGFTVNEVCFLDLKKAEEKMKVFEETSPSDNNGPIRYSIEENEIEDKTS
jgi:hypothetical protein